MKLALKNELLIICVLSLCLAAFIAQGWSGTWRVALGLPFVLFFPGYTLISALYPGKDDMSGIERLALSFGLSIAVVPLIGMILNYTPWGIRLAPLLVSLLFFIATMSVLALYRRKKLAAEERFHIQINIECIKWRELSRLDKALSIVMVGSILFAVGSLYNIGTIPKAGEKFTEFYILGPGGKAEGYPRDMLRGEEKEVIIGIVNHEYSTVTYRVEVRMDGYPKKILNSFILEHEQKWEGPVYFSALESHENLKVEFLLFKEEDSEPYRSLHLWVNIL